MDIGSLLYALVNVFHLDWVSRSNFRLRRSDNLHKDSHQSSWIYPRVKIAFSLSCFLFNIFQLQCFSLVQCYGTIFFSLSIFVRPDGPRASNEAGSTRRRCRMRSFFLGGDQASIWTFLRCCNKTKEVYLRIPSGGYGNFLPCPAHIILQGPAAKQTN